LAQNGDHQILGVNAHTKKQEPDFVKAMKVLHHEAEVNLHTELRIAIPEIGKVRTKDPAPNRHSANQMAVPINEKVALEEEQVKKNHLEDQIADRKGEAQEITAGALIQGVIPKNQIRGSKAEAGVFLNAQIQEATSRKQKDPKVEAEGMQGAVIREAKEIKEVTRNVQIPEISRKTTSGLNAVQEATQKEQTTRREISNALVVVNQKAVAFQKAKAIDRLRNSRSHLTDVIVHKTKPLTMKTKKASWLRREKPVARESESKK
jgi:hypothetical protein